MGFWSRMNADYASRRAQQAPQEAMVGYARKPPEEVPPGGFSFGTSWFGGPYYTDKYGARRAPSPFKLVENYQALVYAMVARKRDAVAKVPLRLYADGSRVQGRPRRSCDPIPVSRAVGQRHARAGRISAAAVDQVYEIRDHPILDALDKPDPDGYFDRTKLIGLLCAYQDVVGQAFLVPEGNGWDWKAGTVGSGPPELLWVIYPQYVIPVRYGSTPLINYWQYFRDYIPKESALWFRQSVSLRDAYGSAFSPTYAGDMYQDQEGKFIANYDQVLGLGVRPDMIATAKDPMMPPGEMERKRFEQDAKRRHSGGNVGGILVNNGAWDFTPMTYSPADLAGKDIAEYDRNCLAAIFGIPPTYFTTDTNLANLEAADESFARFGVAPMCKAIEGPFTHLVQTWDKRLYFEFDPVIAEDELQRAQIDKIYVDMGAVTINQLNEEKKYPKVPWGEEPLFNKNMQTWSQMQESFEQSMEQGKAAMEQGAAGIDHDGQRVEIEKMKAKNQGKPQSQGGNDKPPKRSLDELDAVCGQVLPLIRQALESMAG